MFHLLENHNLRAFQTPQSKFPRELQGPNLSTYIFTFLYPSSAFFFVFLLSFCSFCPLIFPHFGPFIFVAWQFWALFLPFFHHFGPFPSILWIFHFTFSFPCAAADVILFLFLSLPFAHHRFGLRFFDQIRLFGQFFLVSRLLGMVPDLIWPIPGSDSVHLFDFEANFVRFPILSEGHRCLAPN